MEISYKRVRVKECRDVAKNIFLLVLEHGCTESIAGKFFMLRTPNSTALLARPISVYHATEKSTHFLIALKGVGTNELHNLVAGDEVDITGPLGNGFIDSDESLGSTGKSLGEKVCLIGGGIGVAPVACLSEELNKKGVAFDFYASYKTKPYGLDYIKTVESGGSGNKLFITTEDGSAGVKGMLPAVLTSDIIRKEKYSAVYSCGPNAMLRFVKEITDKAGVACYVSLERRMACGVGVCLGCTVETTDGMKRCCKDGPVFDAKKIVTDNKAVKSAQATNCGLCNKEGEKDAKDASSNDGAKRLDVKSVEKGSVTGEESASFKGDDIDTSVKVKCRKSGDVVTFRNPIVASSGTFGFGTEYKSIIDVSKLGGISSKGLTLEAREGNSGVRLWETPSGLLNSIGLQNPGIPYFIDNLLPTMLALDTVTIVNLSGSTADDYIDGARLLEKTAARVIELNISCPNVKTGGAAFGMECNSAKSIVRAIRDVTSKLLVVKLTPQAKDVTGVALGCICEGADAISLCNSFSGVAIDIERGRLVFDRVTAGFGGPAVRPIAMRLVYEVCAAVNKLPESDRVPIFAIGGVEKWRDVVEYIMAGSSIVEVGTATFGNPLSMDECIAGLKGFMARKGYNTIESFRGIAQQ